MIKLYSPKSEVELAMIQSFFEAEGIRFYVQNDRMATLSPLYAMGRNARMIYVPEEDAEAARAILRDIFVRTREDAPPPGQEYSFFEKVRLVLGAFFLGRPLPVKKSRHDDPDAGN